MQELHILNDFVPHKICWLLRSDIIFTHVIGDGLTAFCYYCIPVLLFYATRKYKFEWSLTFIFSVYAGFILLCGTTHLLDVIMTYRMSETLIVFDGWLRVLTGLFSLFSVGVTLWALQIFLTLIHRLFKVSKKINSERERFGKASKKTIDEYNDIINQAQNFLKSREPLEEVE